MVSRFRERFSTVRGMNVSFMFTSVPGGLDLATVQHDLELLVEEAIGIFGVPPSPDHSFLFHFPNAQIRDALGNPAVTVVHWGLQGSGSGPADLLQLALRAFLETWLGGTIRPQALASASLSEPYVTDSLWFLDGAAEYLAEVLMVRAGLKPATAFLDRLNTEITQLQNTPARSSQSAAEASSEVWFQGDEWYRSPDRSLDHRNKGLLLTFFLDLEMRRASENERSIEDLLAFFASYYGRTDGGFDESRDLIRTAGALCRADFLPFLRGYVEGTDELPFDRMMSTLGWVLRPVAEEVATTGFETDAEGVGALRVTGIEERSPAARSGLRPGDRIVSINGSFLVGNLDEVVNASRPGDILTVRIQRGTREEEISFPLGQGNRQAYVVEPLPETDAEQIEIVTSLLGLSLSAPGDPPN
jgi:predicted metalloprotease with PDZ domain